MGSLLMGVELHLLGLQAQSWSRQRILIHQEWTAQEIRDRDREEERVGVCKYVCVLLTSYSIGPLSRVTNHPK